MTSTAVILCTWSPIIFGLLWKISSSWYPPGGLKKVEILQRGVYPVLYLRYGIPSASRQIQRCEHEVNASHLHAVTPPQQRDTLTSLRTTHSAWRAATETCVCSCFQNLVLCVEVLLCVQSQTGSWLFVWSWCGGTVNYLGIELMK